MKRLTLFLVCTLVPSLVSAQTQQTVQGMLSLFEAECPLALNDPKSFIAKLETSGISQGQLVRSSQDQAIFEVSARLGGYVIGADWSNYGSHTLRHCVVNLDHGVVVPAQIGPFLQSWFRARTGAEISGGEVPLGLTMAGGAGVQDGYGRFLINDFIASPLGTTFTTIQTAPGWVSISVSVSHQTIAAGQ